MARPKSQPTPFLDHGKRLKAIRLTVVENGEKPPSQDEFAQTAKISSRHYNEHENGVRLITIERARAIKAAYNVSLDYIYDGDTDRFPYKRQARIVALLAKL